VHERYRQTTDDRQTKDGRATAYSEREHESTFAKKPNRSVYAFCHNTPQSRTHTHAHANRRTILHTP